MDSLRVLSPNRILWRNFTGSGNETAGHLSQNNRMTSGSKTRENNRTSSDICKSTTIYVDLKVSSRSSCICR